MLFDSDPQDAAPATAGSRSRPRSWSSESPAANVQPLDCDGPFSYAIQRGRSQQRHHERLHDSFSALPKTSPRASVRLQRAGRTKPSSRHGVREGHAHARTRSALRGTNSRLPARISSTASSPWGRIHGAPRRAGHRTAAVRGLPASGWLACRIQPPSQSSGQSRLRRLTPDVNPRASDRASSRYRPEASATGHDGWIFRLPRNTLSGSYRFLIEAKRA